METGIKLIAEERKRQEEREGFDADHDVQHDGLELVYAAVSYALPDPLPNWLKKRINNRSDLWPFEKSSWKPTPNNRMRELIKAGALIAAEIDRIKNNPNEPPLER